MRVITHDWPDAFVTRILLQLRHAAAPSAKLIIVDYILPLACEDETEDMGSVKTMAPPGSGLLSNLGKANANAFWLDMTVSDDWVWLTIRCAVLYNELFCRCV
jgi:O-methyltransferase domain